MDIGPDGVVLLTFMVLAMILTGAILGRTARQVDQQWEQCLKLRMAIRRHRRSCGDWDASPADVELWRHVDPSVREPEEDEPWRASLDPVDESWRASLSDD